MSACKMRITMSEAKPAAQCTGSSTYTHNTRPQNLSTSGSDLDKTTTGEIDMLALLNHTSVHEASLHV